tara:strand:- start:44 stop:562 length:519 start_codon:yes stop_codon:yes gene_type:complete
MTECSICLIPTIEEREKCTNDCGHSFCKSCLDTWLNRGKFSCPLCRNPITYFDYNSEKYRLIKIPQRNPINQNQQHQFPTVTINKSVFKCLKFVAFIVTSGVLFQGYLIHHLNSRYNSLKEKYIIDTNNYNKFIHDYNTINLEEQTQVSLFNPIINEYLKCWIPDYFIRSCM